MKRENPLENCCESSLMLHPSLTNVAKLSQSEKGTPIIFSGVIQWRHVPLQTFPFFFCNICSVSFIPHLTLVFQP
jgi:hypothetical protein